MKSYSGIVRLALIIYIMATLGADDAEYMINKNN